MSTNKQFKKESALAKTAMSFDQLKYYRAKTAARLDVIRTADLFTPDDIKRVTDTIADYDRRIARRERKIVREARSGMLKQAAAVGLAS